MEVEAGVPTEGPVSAVPSLLSAGPVAYTLHIGPYAEVGRAYRRLVAWMVEHGRESVGAPREVYLLGPTQAQTPAEYRTEVVWRIR